MKQNINSTTYKLAMYLSILSEAYLKETAYCPKERRL